MLRSLEPYQLVFISLRIPWAMGRLSQDQTDPVSSLLNLSIGDLVPTRTSPPPEMDEAGKAARMAKALSLVSKYRTEILIP